MYRTTINYLYGEASFCIYVGDRSLDLVPAILNSWKEVAVFLNKGVRTVQRWEETQGLPVHRVGNGRKAPVFAFAAELRKWSENKRVPAEMPSTPLSRMRPSQFDTEAIDQHRRLRRSARELLSAHSNLLLALQGTLQRVDATCATVTRPSLAGRSGSNYQP